MNSGMLPFCLDELVLVSIHIVYNENAATGTFHSLSLVPWPYDYEEWRLGMRLPIPLSFVNGSNFRLHSTELVKPTCPKVSTWGCTPLYT